MHSTANQREEGQGASAGGEVFCSHALWKPSTRKGEPTDPQHGPVGTWLRTTAGSSPPESISLLSPQRESLGLGLGFQHVSFREGLLCQREPFHPHVCPSFPGAEEEIHVLPEVPLGHGGASGLRGRGEESPEEIPPGLAHSRRIPTHGSSQKP